jgi:hypothetical protein
MQTVGPYTLLTVLSGCQVGEAWSAMDDSGRPVTIAVLNARASADQRWRDAFAATATALAQTQVDRLPMVGADFQAEAPWVACAPERGPGAARVFMALGQTMLPVHTPPLAQSRPVHTPPVAVPQDAGPRTGPKPATNPWKTPPSDGGDAVVDARTGPPAPPVSAEPEPAAVPDAAEPAFSSTGRPVHHAGRRRPGVLVALVAVVALALGAAAGGTAVALRADPPTTTVSSSPTGNVPVDVALPTASPSRPGVEPPQGGGWPTDWPRFNNEPTRRMSSLDGLGFSFDVPADWTCVQHGRTAGSAWYRCGVPAGEDVSVGGDVIVRTCTRLCTEDRRTTMRRAEEAWGLRWIRSGPFTTWAQSDKVDGGRYGLVYMSYWRSRPEDAIDRQLILRMTAPADQAPAIRKVANSVREVTFTI